MFYFDNLILGTILKLFESIGNLFGLSIGYGAFFVIIILAMFFVNMKGGKKNVR